MRLIGQLSTPHPVAARAPRSALLARAVLIAIATGACTQTPSRSTIGPAGGVIASEDDGFTMVLWPGALGGYEDFEVVQTSEAPESFGAAYRVTPNLALGIDAEIILRGNLPMPTSLARVGALSEGAGDWRSLPLDPQGIDANDGTVRGHDGQISLYYAMLDGGDIGGTDTIGMDTSSTTDDPTSDSGDPTGPPVSFAADVQPILDESCSVPSSCHGISAAGSLDLETNAYENLVGVAAHVDGSLVRVIAGNSDDSLLMNKLDFAPPPNGGLPMPTGGMLPAPPIELIRAWIDQGCPP